MGTVSQPHERLVTLSRSALPLDGRPPLFPSSNPSQIRARFRPARPTVQKDNAMSEKTVRYTPDPDHLPQLTDKQKAELQALAQRPDSAIDSSDILPVTDEFFENAKRSRFHRPPK